ncbi:RrF2 family transcriptional regulator [Pseudonocardia sp. HH130630-07]|uniref:RrF2 family transcriptional regulator n=1 Tax=Pseudonocardia sp. HH130630-07 TaxID=1690815 RepID=UPI000814D7A4|nr:Rrf2 family transcriptional regulator [Pseudonocardia sp. HH130630-07]ANY10353.1 Rrf2 family transcriptional regulator [Pseudonocardia sp. HH130630-07]
MAGSTSTRFAVAVHVLTYLAGVRDRPVSSDELSASTNVNAVHVRRVLGPLRDAGIVRSRSGPGGGWELAAGPCDLTLATVWRLVADDQPVLGLHGPDPACPVGRTVRDTLRDLDDSLAAVVVAELERRTVGGVLADLVADTGAERPRGPGECPG